MRISWITAAAILVSTQATAGLEQDLLSCSAKADKLDRLICYDQISASVKSASKVTNSISPSTAPATTVVATTSVAATSQSVTAIPTTLPANIEDDFGNLKKKEGEAVKKIFLEVDTIKKDVYGALRITFKNSQVWKQTESKRFKLESGQTVYIEKGAFGAFYLGVKDRNSTIKVKRLK
ncbi:hypothetical protein Sps_03055 [Shewanella psychrophila]|uniref:Uncharacterized protein n=1 Tax=Shewanella psychrophila TaxID=225848 RepID=A0A1S6HRR8_9GAMM|nr:hypothetical protein [Shewanella psychrophila]AQS38202.1 hypothetical protein Sps_03055 [Shewanella psychrophila]